MPGRYRKRRYRKYKKTAKSVAYKALKLARKANASTEIKFVDTPIALTNVNWLGTPLSILNDTNQGLADNEHVGDKVLCTSIRWRGQVAHFASIGTHIRIIIFYDKYNTINAPSDLLESTGGIVSVVSDYTIDKRSDYNIISDKVYNCDGVNTDVRWFRGHHKIGKKTNFSGGTNGIEKGAIKHFAISDLDPASSPQMNYQMYFRVYYADA